jgi:hypothetical protein
MFPSRRTKPNGIATSGGEVLRDDLCWRFDGDTTSALLGSTISLPAAFTICGWVKTDGTQAKNSIIGTGNTTLIQSNQCSIIIEPASARINIRINTTNIGNLTGLTMSHNKWHFVQVTRDPLDNITGYVDGRQSSNTLTTSDASQAADTFYIDTIGEGATASSYHHFGWISEMVVYKGQTLLLPQHKTMYNARESFDHVNWHYLTPEVWYRFGDGKEGNLVLTSYDMSTNSNNATAENITVDEILSTGGY